MAYRIAYTASAVKTLRTLDRQAARGILQSIEKPADDPRPPGCVALQDGDGEPRIRVGGYRIVYGVKDGESTILLLRTGHRGSVHRQAGAPPPPMRGRGIAHPGRVPEPPSSAEGPTRRCPAQGGSRQPPGRRPLNRDGPTALYAAAGRPAYPQAPERLKAAVTAPLTAVAARASGPLVQRARGEEKRRTSHRLSARHLGHARAPACGTGCGPSAERSAASLARPCSARTGRTEIRAVKHPTRALAESG